MLPVGIKAFLDLNSRFTDERDTGLDIVKFIHDNIEYTKGKKELYSRSGDCLLVWNPGMCVVDPILYGEELLGRWSHFPFEWLMQYFLEIDDAWITTTPPTVTYYDVWNIEKELEVCLKDLNYKKAETIAQSIIHSGLNQNEQVLGACLWYPVGHNDDGIVVFHTLKTILNDRVLCNNRIHQTFINYSTLADSGHLFENGYEDITKDGVCLSRIIVGSAQFVLGNCQIYPANILREKFKWTPLFSNPFVWTDDKAEKVLRFERIIYPNRDTFRQHYIRQPILFRWVVDKTSLENQFKKYGLISRAVYNTMPYDKVFGINED